MCVQLVAVRRCLRMKCIMCPITWSRHVGTLHPIVLKQCQSLAVVFKGPPVLRARRLHQHQSDNNARVAHFTQIRLPLHARPLAALAPCKSGLFAHFRLKPSRKLNTFVTLHSQILRQTGPAQTHGRGSLAPRIASGAPVAPETMRQGSRIQECLEKIMSRLEAQKLPTFPTLSVSSSSLAAAFRALSSWTATFGRFVSNVTLVQTMHDAKPREVELLQ